jgi:hypothetical protein
MNQGVLGNLACQAAWMAGEVFSERRNFTMMKRLAVLIGMMAIWVIFPADANAQYKQIIVATGSPFELGLIDAQAKGFRRKPDVSFAVLRLQPDRVSSWVAMGLPISRWAIILRPQRNSYRMGMRQEERTSCII